MFTKKNSLPLLMWLFPLAFFTYQFILRLWPGLMMQPIMQQFSIDATQFGFMAAIYYYGYAGMQIPVAFLLEKYGPRYIVALFAILCGLATLLFTYTDNWYLACLSRFLVGAGSAVGFLGVSKVISEWFPQNQYTRMVGFSFTIGLMGAIYGGKPVSMLITTYEWQNVALYLACFSLILGLSTYFLLRSPQKVALSNQSSFKFAYFKELLSSPILWCLAVANLLMVGSLEGFSDVWGVQYLMTAYAIPKEEAAELISFVFFGMLFGGPLLALLSKRLGNYFVIAACGILMTILFTTLLFSTHYQWWYLAGLFFILGVLCCYQVIVFAAGSEMVKQQLLGVTVAFLNCINMLGGSFFHSCIGRIMDLYWDGTMNAAGMKEYDLAAYQSALWFIPACALVGAIIVTMLGIKLRQQRIICSKPVEG